MLFLFRLFGWVATVLVVLAAYRFAARRSPLLAGMVAVGIGLRAVTGVALYTISLFELPVLTSLQSGGGFWKLAIDAHYYFNVAAHATQVGLQTISDTEPSPAFIRMLAAWMSLVGMSPASGVLFNLLCYVGLSTIVIGSGTRERELAVSLAALTVSPAFLIFTTQPLKDPFCLLLIGGALWSLQIWCEGVRQTTGAARRYLWPGVLGTTAAVYFVSGVRPYIGAMIIVATAAAGAATVITHSAPMRRRNTLLFAVLLLALLGSFARGAGAYFPYYQSMATRLVYTPSTPLAALDSARSGFVAAGGATSMDAVRPPREPSEGTSGLDVSSSTAGQALTRVSRLVRGCLTLFVPISLLQFLGLVTFSGGRGLLFLTDIDTLVNDFFLIACLYVVWQQRPTWRWPTVICVGAFALMITFAMAYVVTNFGTLFRLRLMAMLPFWLLPALIGYELPRFGHERHSAGTSAGAV